MPWTSNATRLDNATLSLLQNTLASTVTSAVYALVTAVSLTGNGLSLWLLLFRTSPKTPSIVFMIHLTLTDLALGAALPFQINYQLRGYDWTLGPGMCRFLTLVFFTNMYCSILTMTAISVDRYLGILHPLWFRQTLERKSLAVTCCLLMWAVVLSAFFPLMTTDLTFRVPELGITTCFDVLKKDMFPTLLAWSAFLFTLVFLLFLLPFCVTAFCYVGVIRELARDEAKTRQKAKAVRLAAAVLLVFTVCFAPNNLLLLAHSVSRLFFRRSLYAAYKLSLCLSCLNSCVDPFIYYFASGEFRKKLRRMLRLRSHLSSGGGEEAGFRLMSRPISTGQG